MQHVDIGRLSSTAATTLPVVHCPKACSTSRLVLGQRHDTACHAARTEDTSYSLSHQEIVSAGSSLATFSRREAAFLLAAPLLTAWLVPRAAAESSEPTEAEIRAAVQQAFERVAGKSKAPVLLRLAFHDAGTFQAAAGDGGANASIRFELQRPENQGLNRGWRVIEQTAAELKGTAAEGRVSMADLVALGGAYGVRVTGGPSIEVPLGRRDATAADPPGRMPAETSSAEQLLQIFAAKGFTTQEFVALSGAHTLGSKGFGDPVTFDNAYYSSLLRRPWTDKSNSMASMIGLPSDHVLPDSPDCVPVIQRYANDQDVFFGDFAAAYVKMTLAGAVLA